jgi:hypothetical protein
VEASAIGQLDLIDAGQIAGSISPKADRHRPGTQHGFRRLQPLELRPGLHTFSRLARFDQSGKGLALEIGDIEDRHRPVAGPAAQGDFTANAWLLTAVELGPQDVNVLAALAGEDAEIFGLGKAAPERQGRTPDVHAEGEQDRIGAAVAMAREQIDVAAAACAILGPQPGGGAGLHQLDQGGDDLLLGRGAFEGFA